MFRTLDPKSLHQSRPLSKTDRSGPDPLLTHAVRLFRSVLPAVLAVFAVACAAHPKPPPPFTPPPVSERVGHRPGGVLARQVPATGPSTDEIDVHLKIVAVEKPLPAIGDPLATHAQLVWVSHGSRPVLPVERLTKSIRLVSANASQEFDREMRAGRFGRTAILPAMETVLDAGVTCRFEIAQNQPQTDVLSGRPAQRKFRLEITRGPGDRMLAALVMEDFVGGGSANGSVPAVLQTETVVLDPIPTATPAAVFIVPFAVSDTSGFALILDAGKLFDDQRHAALLAKARADVRADAQTATTLPTTLPLEEPFAIQSALLTLGRHPDDRSAMVFVADQTGGRLCSAVAIVADGQTLTRLSQSVVKQAGANPDSTQLGWTMDRCALELLASQLSAESIAPELSAVATEYAGEAGRHAVSIEEALREGGNRESAHAAFVAENLIFLEDSSPAARVRAFDWLSQRGRAPRGYDPLAPPQQRRGALENALAAATTQPAEGRQP